MPTAKKRVSTSTTVQKLSLDQVHSLLQDLPEKQKESLTLREAVKQLQAPIKSALEKGYSLEEIVAILAEKDIKITLSSLRYYLTVMKKDAAAPKAKKTRKSSARKSASSQKEAPKNGFVSPDAPTLDVEPSAPSEIQPAPKTRAKRGRKTQEQQPGQATETAPTTTLEPATPKQTRSTRTRSKTAAKVKSEPRTKAKSQPADSNSKTPATKGRRKAKAAS